MKTLADIKKIAVLGAGTMGPGIAQTYAMGGYNVTMWTRSEATREKAKAALKTQLETFAEEGEIKAEDVEAIFARTHFELTVEDAVPEGQYLFRLVRNDTGAAIYVDQQSGSAAFTVAPDPAVLSQLLPQQLLTLTVTSDHMERELSLTLGYYNGIPCDCYLPGDTNLDGKVDRTDAQNVVDAVAKRESVDVPLYDADGNGVVTVRDALRILTQSNA